MKKLFLILSVFIAELAFSQTVKSIKIESGEAKEMKFDALSKEKITSFDANFSKFITALKASDRKTSDALLSEKARMVVTDNVYKKLSADIKFNKKLEIYKSGYKILKDGSSYPMIQYKYADDKAKTPSEIVTAVFEEDGKILGIKPAKTNKVK
ncbi:MULTISPECIES: peptidylprolyl isomerase [unclassified Chryseobacterium]|uniref:peptidylprolyl isomerase n=1 Tax=unclassified Chryseobacterium TaxID=2593645 RepID=UPI00226981F9|nr:MULTISPECIES: peptidylprolyl isomerase [unclassified Chryseobacterium]